jgi:hypothetical protein
MLSKRGKWWSKGGFHLQTAKNDPNAFVRSDQPLTIIDEIWQVRKLLLVVHEDMRRG